MTLIKSISGIRGIIYDDDSEGLSTIEITNCVKQFIMWMNKKILSTIKLLLWGVMEELVEFEYVN